MSKFDGLISESDTAAVHAPEWFSQWPHADDYAIMKAITVWQPWATLIALRLKRMETRGWPTKHRGPLAIHAAKKIDQEACEREPIKSLLAQHGYTADNLPTGAVVAVAQLTECWNVLGESQVPVPGTMVLNDPTNERMFGLLRDTNEFKFGDFTAGRYAWWLGDVLQLPQPIPAIGRQGLWNWQQLRYARKFMSEE